MNKALSSWLSGVLAGVLGALLCLSSSQASTVNSPARLAAVENMLKDTTDEIEIGQESLEASVNNLPVIESIGSKVITEGKRLNFYVKSFDVESYPVLEVEGMPEGASFIDFGDGTGVFDWKPKWTVNSSNTGKYIVTFYATDDSGVYAYEEITIVVIKADAKEPFENRLVLSIFIGPGFPISDFSSSSGGNHKSGGADVVLEFEWYFAKQVSLGLALWSGFYDDKDFGEDLQTSVFTGGGFIKYTLATGRDWFPYGKFGLGWTELEFEDPALTIKTDGGMGLRLGTGVLWRVSDLISVNGELAYNHSFVEDAQIKGFTNTVVGFDVQNIAIDAGISFFL